MKLKSKVFLSYLNVVFFIVFFQFFFQPELYSYSESSYEDFNKVYYLISFLSVTINSVIFNYIVSTKKDNIYLFVIFIPINMALSIFFIGINDLSLLISIIIYDSVVNINRIYERDDKIIINTVLSSSLCVFIYYIFNVNIETAFFISLFVCVFVSFGELYKSCVSLCNFKFIIDFSNCKNFNKTMIFTLSKNIERSGDKILINYLGLSSGILPILNLSGLIVIPIQTVSKIIMTNRIDKKINLKFNHYIFFGFIFFILFLISIITISYLLNVFYGIDYNNVYDFVIIIVFYKMLLSIDILLFSNNLKKVISYFHGYIYFLLIIASVVLYFFFIKSILICITLYVTFSFLYTIKLVRMNDEK